MKIRDTFIKEILKTPLCFFVTSVIAFICFTSLFADEPNTSSVNIEQAPTNKWVLISTEKTGWREQPIFVYAPNIKKAILASGVQTGGGIQPRHYDTEELDLKTFQWINAYPEGLEKGRSLSGPVSEEYSKSVVNVGTNGFEYFFKDNGVNRIAAGGQWAGFKTSYEWCYNPEDGMVYTYLGPSMLRYDPIKRTWENLKSNARTSNKIWGSMAYDPINKEIFHAGGDGATYNIGTWVYNIEKNEWKKLELGNDDARKILKEARQLSWQAKLLLGAVTNRFAISETTDEAKANLKTQAEALASGAEQFAKAVQDTPKAGSGKASIEAATKRLANASKALKEISEKLTVTITPETIGAVRAIRIIFEQIVDTLEIEPPGRAHSQVAYDTIHKKMVIFGGDALDRVRSDTWVYDCTTKTWEQRFPETCPTPRAGHILVWAENSKKFVLAGGYSRIALKQDLWTYDVATNKWEPLMSTEGETKPITPMSSNRNVQVGVYENNILFSVEPGAKYPSRNNWICKIDTAKPDSSASKALIAHSGDYTFNPIDPAIWEAVAKPNAEATKKFYDEMPMNQWTSIPFAKYAPGATNRWGTSAYDADRHQFLLWGGGHATTGENDVSHFSILGGCWTVGYNPDDPIQISYAWIPTPVTYTDRPRIPMHAYRCYAYDPITKNMIYLDRIYDTKAREWVSQAIPNLKLGSKEDKDAVLGTQTETTPKGVITYSSAGLFQYDSAGNTWKQLPWLENNPKSIYCDGPDIVFDSKRNSFWLADKTDIYLYNFDTTKAEKITPTKPKELGEYMFWSESVYLPEEDLILIMKIFKNKDGVMKNVVFNPNDKKFYWVEGLKFVENGKDIAFETLTKNSNMFGFSDAIAYDPKLKLILLNSSAQRKVWALKFDAKQVKLTPMTD